jgi:hypothetical protein
MAASSADLKFVNGAAELKVELPSRGILQFFVNEGDSVQSVASAIADEDEKVEAVEFFRMVQQKKSVNSAELVENEQPLGVEDSLLEALEDQSAPLFFRVDGNLHKLPFTEAQILKQH